MNRDSLQKKLIRAARLNPPSDHVPYAFEKRVMARLGRRVEDEWPSLIRAFWWAAAACSAIAISMGVWSLRSDSTADNGRGFSTDLEQTILASADDWHADPEIEPTENELEQLW